MIGLRAKIPSKPCATPKHDCLTVNDALVIEPCRVGPLVFMNSVMPDKLRDLEEIQLAVVLPAEVRDNTQQRVGQHPQGLRLTSKIFAAIACFILVRVPPADGRARPCPREIPSSF